MARPLARGMYRQRDARSGAVFPTWYVRRDVPKDLKAAFGKSVLVETTGETDDRRAAVVADRLWQQWSSEFAARRTSTGASVATLADALAAIERWRSRECAQAAGLTAVENADPQTVAFLADLLTRPKAADGMVQVGTIQLPNWRSRTPVTAVSGHAVRAADAYFSAHPMASREIDTSWQAWARLRGLAAAADDASAWARFPNFDGELDAALIAGGLTGMMTPMCREDARLPFARAALEVERAKEAERRRHAAVLATVEASKGAEAVMAPKATGYQPRPDDRTVAELITAFKSAKDRPDLDKTHGHIFTALGQLLGPDKPIRAVSREDVRDIKRLLANVPTNYRKLYGPDVTLEEASDRGAEDGRPTLAPNTVRSYLINGQGIFRFALEEGWLEVNPFRGLVPSRSDQVVRRAFSAEELGLIFGALTEERAVDSERFWIPAILAFSGARANEVCQLHTGDVRTMDGVPFLDFSLFDAQGKRADKKLKNPGSARWSPLHPEIVKSGFLEFVQRQKSAGADRLFPALQPNTLGYYSHELSRWWGRHLDSVGLSDPGHCLHSLRHGFRLAGNRAGLSDEVIDIVGGWAATSQGSRYGRADAVRSPAEFAPLIAKIDIGLKLSQPRSKRTSTSKETRKHRGR